MATDRSLPLLRSPPFPGIARAVAAVSTMPTDGVSSSIPDSQVDAVLDAVRTAAVGGLFWGEPAVAPASTVVRYCRGDDRARLAREIPPSARWIVTATDRSRPVDPWSLLMPGMTVIAHGDDEWCAIAVLAGADLRLLSPGRFGSPEDERETLCRLIAAQVLACRYRDPFSGEACSLDQVLPLLTLWRDQIAANRGVVAAAGMAWWKRAEIRRFLWAPRRAGLPFLSGLAAVRGAATLGGAVAIWPSRVAPAAVSAADRQGVPLVNVEDGFVRSVGLGVHLVPPLSVTVDPIGIHYDPSRPSELERLMEGGGFPPALLDRAVLLRTHIVANRIGKYGSAAAAAPVEHRSDRRLVLVPGQVEDDRSVLLGGGDVAGNLDLLRRVRLVEPGAEIWFRPHPDVDAGHRVGGVADADALRHVDRVVRGGGMATLLDQVDAVHVLTSLTGFEALLRGCEVICHGVPFFAGWGLTRDLAAIPARRGRCATLDELVAATLILYPRYLDPVTMLPCPPEVLVSRIAAQPADRSTMLVRLRQIQGWLSRRG